MKPAEIPVLAILLFMLTQWTFAILVLFGFVLSVQCNVPQYTSISQSLQSQTTSPLQDPGYTVTRPSLQAHGHTLTTPAASFRKNILSLQSRQLGNSTTLSSKITNRAPTINYFQSQVIQILRTSKKKVNVIAPGCASYMDMLYQGESFVDKSMLIPYLLDSGFKVNWITTPRRWGKTMNIGMLKHFFQAQVDLNCSLLRKDKMSNYDLFVNNKFIDDEGDVHTLDRSFAISQYPQILNAHLGNHFVIHLDFGGIPMYNFSTAAAGIIQTIEELFANVEYVVTMLTESKLKATTPQLQEQYSSDITNFNTYKNHHIYGYTISDYCHSLVFLCRVMQEQANLRGLEYPIILIDEHDASIFRAFVGKIKWSKQDQKSLMNFFACFLCDTFKTNENYRLAVITGGLRIIYNGLFPGFNHFKHLNFLNSDDVFFYYGFHEDEVKELLHRYNVDDDEAKSIRNFYNGYKGGENFKLSMYNPWDVATYLSKRILKSYWVDTGEFRELLISYSRYEIYQRQLLHLITGHPVAISRALSVEEEDLEQVGKDLHSVGLGMESDLNLYNLFRLLYAAGYLTHILPENTHRINKMDFVCAKIPNAAIKMELSLRLREDLLEPFYNFVGMYDTNSSSQERYHIFKHTFLDYLRSTSTNTKLLGETCRNMLMNLPNFEHKSSLKAFWLKHLPAITGNEALARLVFDYTVVFESGDLFSFVGLEETFKFLGTTRRIDLVLTFKDKKQYSHAVIIDYKYSSNALTHKNQETNLNAAQRCLNYSSFFFAEQLDDRQQYGIKSGIKSLKCLEISVKSTKAVLIHNYYINETTYAKYTESLKNLLKSHNDEERKIEFSNYDQNMQELFKKSNEAHLELLKVFLQ